MSKLLAGKVAVITGAAQGLGAAFALALAEEGAAVVVGDLASTADTCAAVAAVGGQARGVQLDVLEARSVQNMMAAAIESFGRLDILVNNAAISGTLQLKPLLEVSSEEWDRVMAVNVRGAFECIKAAVPLMKAAGYGKIINLSSGTAIKGSVGLPHYVASKGAIISLTRAAAREFGADGIRVNALAPGLTMSEAMKENPSWSGDVVANNIASRALKRQAVPDDLLGTLIFLASPMSDFMTGQTLSVDGGSVMN
ncbi:glucose 1-dehydrogenase [Bradyrhizobium sp. BRP22]|uniref:SDR family NAD(P)-dependent oxidoreductase n=1 Tax=Bradyrhizobium sp. BRP22 TaxID=2793821 RepID=UPI001CD306DF|nr:glucose 1-dehydrogenase [Bradyrhizobium sp. BRP22]MCA1452640.1 glucose 1-dehydrogenase [Bradyrhizobium sp. BRP22]